MRRILAVIVASALLSGCTGSFALTRKVYSFHHQQKDKWMDELLFLGFVILPVYGLATLGDAIIFNTAEFWTGNNPITQASTRKLTEGDLQVLLTYSPGEDEVRIASSRSLNLGVEFVVHRSPAEVSAEDREGRVLFTSVTEADGGISVYDGNRMLVRHFPPRQVREVSGKIMERDS